MDLHGDVKKATSLSLTDNVKFFHLKDLSQAEKDRKMNERKVKPPRNLILLEDDAINNDQEDDISREIKSTFHKCEISAAIKEVNGGLDLSNKHWENYWAKHLEKMTNFNRKESCELSSQKSTETNSGDQPNTKNSEYHKLMKQKDKIFRNAAIMGLVNTNKILLEDLINSNSKSCTKEEDRLKTLDTHDAYRIEFVSLCEDPEVFIHPLRMGIDVKKYKDINFTVQSVGKKIKETPQQYFLRTTNDDSFEFVKQNSTMKK